MIQRTWLYAGESKMLGAKVQNFFAQGS